MKTLGGDAFYSCDRLHHYFKNLPKNQKLVQSPNKTVKDSEPADIIIHSEIFLDIFQTYKIQTRSTCIIKNDAVL